MIDYFFHIPISLWAMYCIIFVGDVTMLMWLSGRVLDSRPRDRGFEPHRCHCVVSLSKNKNLSLVLVQPRKTPPFITERLLMERKESYQTNKQNRVDVYNDTRYSKKVK